MSKKRRFLFLLLVIFLPMSTQAVPPSIDTYHPFYEADGIDIKMSQREEVPWIQATFEVPTSAERVINLLSNFANYGDTFSNMLVKAEVLNKGSDVGVPFARLYVVLKTPFPYKNRDAVVAYRLQFNPDGTRIVTWQPDEKSDDPQEGVRLKNVEGMTQITPISGSSCRVTYSYKSDDGGLLGFFVKRSRRNTPIAYRQAILDSLGL